LPARATNQVLAGFFRVGPRTVDNWIATHPDFADAVYRGRAVADAGSSLPCSSAPRVSATRSPAPRSTGARRRTVTNTVSYPPDTNA